MFDFDGVSHGMPNRMRDEDGRPLAVSWTADFHGKYGGLPFARLVIDFDTEGNVVGAHLTRTDGHFTATDLARFPWSRWIGAALHMRKAHLRIDEDGTLGQEFIDGQRALDALAADSERERKRPGRAGHPREFYEALAARYSALVAEGVPNPVQALTDEHIGRGEHVSRNTVATWIKRARSLGLLPPGRARPTANKEDSP